ncbi:hypothetical protein ABZ445_15970 [Streptomyces chartreusis]|uniref:hypothetical protein n=1 Tax=Streptomyces chartreusis TaxID=1969 RepID=UPI0033F11823
MGLMEIYGLAAVIVALIGAFAWILVAALRKVPTVCREAKKAVRAVRDLLDEIRRPQRPEVNPPQSDNEQHR